MLFYTLFALALLGSVQATPTGNHTCTGVVKHEVTVRVNVTEPVTFRSYEWCLRVPPRCSTYTIQLKDRVKVHREMHNRTITVCCKGYVEIDYKCVPACPPETECPNMHCNRTNHCYCTPGYTGLYCNHPCPKGVWGAGCIKPCDCPAGYTCHHLTGDCFIDDSPPSKTRRTTTASHLLTEAATTLMTTHTTTQATTILITTPTPTTIRTTTTLPTTTTIPTTVRSTTTTTTERATSVPSTTTTTTERVTSVPSTTTSTTTERPTSVPSTTTIMTTIQNTTPERTTTTTTEKIIPTSTTDTSTMPPPTVRTTIEEPTSIRTTQNPEITTNPWLNTVHSTTLNDLTKIGENLTSTPHTVATTVTRQSSTMVSTVAPVTEATVLHLLTEVPTPATEMVSTTSTTERQRAFEFTPSTTTVNNKYIDDIATTSSGFPKMTYEQKSTAHFAAERNTEQYERTETTQATIPVITESQSTTEQAFEKPSIATTPHFLQTSPATTGEQTTTTTETTTKQKTSTTETEKPSTTQETSGTPVEEPSTTKQVTTATPLVIIDENVGKKLGTWHKLDESSSSYTTTGSVDDSLRTLGTEKMPIPKSTPHEAAETAMPTSLLELENSRITNYGVNEGIGQVIEEMKYTKAHKLPEKSRGFQEMPTSTTDRLDGFIVEDVPKAAPPVSTDENPIKLVEEVISKYFPDTFKKAGIGRTNPTESLVEAKNKEKGKTPLMPPRNVGKEQSSERPKSEVDAEPITEATTFTSLQPMTEPTLPSTTVSPTIPVITPKVIVSAKNPDEIDLGGVIYRKMKLFPPVKPPMDYTTSPDLGIQVDVTPSKEQSDKEATTPASDRFKIYLPEYDKEVIEFETTETPVVKTFTPKYNFEREDFDFGKQAQAKKAKQKDKDLKKYKVKQHEVTNAPVDSESKSNERVTNNVFLETKEFKVHLASTKSQKFGESYYTKAPIDQDSTLYDLNKLAKKKSKFGSGDHEAMKFGKHTSQSQDFDETATTQSFSEINNPTTNPKPPHTWYSHAREKAKIKSALKIMKSTMTLDLNVKPTLDSMMEESNDIHSMATQYTEREPRSAVAAVTYQDDLNNPQMFGQVKFNAPEGYTASMSESAVGKITRLGLLTSIAVGGACFMAMASLVAVLWLRLKTRWSQMRKTESDHEHEESQRPVATTSNYETVYPVHRETDEIEVATFLCPTFTNNYAERINREFLEMSYDHPRASFSEPLYAEILHPKIRVLTEEEQ